MVKIIERKLIRLANMLCLTLPSDFVEKFQLKKGDVVDLVMLNDTILVTARSINYNAEGTKADLDMLQKSWDLNDRETRKWFDKLSPEEQAKTIKKWEEIARAIEEIKDITCRKVQTTMNQEPIPSITLLNPKTVRASTGVME